MPRKNLTSLCGKPLLSYTCEAALASSLLESVIVSTDDPEIADVADQSGIRQILHRAPQLAADDTPMIDVVRDTAAQLDERDIPWRVIVLLQPTSPLRNATHIDAALTLMAKSSAATIVSVTPVPHRFVPESLMVLDERGILVPLKPGDPVTRRQDKPRLYARNGPAILAVSRSTLEAGRLYGDPTVGYIMSANDSVDIDDEDDLRLAAFLLSAR